MCVLNPCRDMTEAMPSLEELLGGSGYVEMWETWYVLPIVLMQHLNLFIPFIYGSIVIIFVTFVVCKAALSPGDADNFLKYAMHRYVKEQDYKAVKDALFEEFAATEYSRDFRCIHIYKPPPPTRSV